jgi:hypothetical protein
LLDDEDVHQRMAGDFITEGRLSTRAQTECHTTCIAAIIKEHGELKMKVLAIGAAGKMGKAVVSYFADDPAVETLGLLDTQESVLKSRAEGDRTGKFRLHPLDIGNIDNLRVMSNTRRRRCYQIASWLSGDGTRSGTARSCRVLENITDDPITIKRKLHRSVKLCNAEYGEPP